jgi:hypothetical protein
MKDYSGGKNQWLPCDIFELGDYEKLIDVMLALRITAKEDLRHAA